MSFSSYGLPASTLISHSQGVENIWPDKVEYSINIPMKAVVFGTAIPIDIILVPLLKGLTIGKVICSLKELHYFTLQERNAHKTDVREILEQTFEGGYIETEDSEDLGKWRMQERVDLPKSLIRCVQDCEMENIKVRHK